MNPLGQRMQDVRKASGLNLAFVASVMGISAQALSQIERGVTKNVRLEHFLRFCAFFNSDPYFIVLGSDGIEKLKDATTDAQIRAGLKS